MHANNTITSGARSRRVEADRTESCDRVCTQRVVPTSSPLFNKSYFSHCSGYVLRSLRAASLLLPTSLQRRQRVCFIGDCNDNNDSCAVVKRCAEVLFVQTVV